jgi:hypothetical protein
MHIHVKKAIKNTRYLIKDSGKIKLICKIKSLFTIYTGDQERLRYTLFALK